MIYQNKKLFGLLFVVIFLIGKDVFPQNDSLMLYKQLELQRNGVAYFNMSKSDKFNFEVVVVGGVRQPGIYLLPEGTTVLELIALAGGAGDESILDNFKLIRAKYKNPELKADTIIVISYKDFFDKDKTGSFSKKNPLLKPGDILAFSIKPDKDFWDYANRLSAVFVLPIVSIATLIIAILNYQK